MTNGGHIKMLYFELQDTMDAQEETLGCQEAPDIFFPEDFANKRVREESVALAKSLCEKCPIQLECLAYAVQAKEEWGIWGGQTTKERQPSSGSRFR